MGRRNHEIELKEEEMERDLKRMRIATTAPDAHDVEPAWVDGFATLPDPLIVDILALLGPTEAFLTCKLWAVSSRFRRLLPTVEWAALDLDGDPWVASRLAGWFFGGMVGRVSSVRVAIPVHGSLSPRSRPAELSLGSRVLLALAERPAADQPSSLSVRLDVPARQDSGRLAPDLPPHVSLPGVLSLAAHFEAACPSGGSPPDPPPHVCWPSVLAPFPALAALSAPRFQATASVVGEWAARYPRLRSLSASFADGPALACAGAFRALEELHVSGDCLSGLAPLSAQPAARRLRALSLQWRPVQTGSSEPFAPLAAFEALESLRLTIAPMGDSSPEMPKLASLRRLRELALELRVPPRGCTPDGAARALRAAAAAVAAAPARLALEYRTGSGAEGQVPGEAARLSHDAATASAAFIRAAGPCLRRCWLGAGLSFDEAQTLADCCPALEELVAEVAVLPSDGFHRLDDLSTVFGKSARIYEAASAGPVPDELLELAEAYAACRELAPLSRTAPRARVEVRLGCRGLSSLQLFVHRAVSGILSAELPFVSSDGENVGEASRAGTPMQV